MGLLRQRGLRRRIALRWRDADGVGSAGADAAAWGWAGAFVEADFDSGEVVVAATDSEAGGWYGRVGGLEEVD